MKKRYDLIIFDLDGTLYNSYYSITKSFQYVVREMCGIDESDLEVFRPFIGPPLVDSLASYGIEGDELIKAAELYREHYKTTLDETVLYDGMKELLVELKTSGFKLAIASSKLIHVIRAIVERDDIVGLFDVVEGLGDYRNKETKAAVIARTLDNFENQRRASAVMVGDRLYDAAGAKEAGVDFIAAGYGPGFREEFEPYPMVHYAESVKDLRDYLVGP